MMGCWSWRWLLIVWGEEGEASSPLNVLPGVLHGWLKNGVTIKGHLFGVFFCLFVAVSVVLVLDMNAKIVLLRIITVGVVESSLLIFFSCFGVMKIPLSESK